MGHMAWGTGCILEDDRHQGLADGCFPAPGSLGPLPAGPPWGPARGFAHKVGGVGSDNLEAVWVGAWWHKAEVLGRLYGEDFRQWNFLAGHRASTREGSRLTLGLSTYSGEHTEPSVIAEGAGLHGGVRKGLLVEVTLKQRSER